MSVTTRNRNGKKYYEVSYQHEGKNYYGGTFDYTKKGKRLAQDKYDYLKAKVKNGEIEPTLRKITLKKVYDEWLEVEAIKYHENTIATTKYYFQCFEEFHNKQIGKITYANLQRFFNQRSNDSKAINTEMKLALNRVFRYAINNGYIKDNPLDRVTITGFEHHREGEKVISFENFTQLTGLLDSKTGAFSFRFHAYSVAIKIAYYTGLRVSEVFALEKSDIDFENDTIDVNKILIYQHLKKSELHVTSVMKSKKSKAVLPLAYDLKLILLEWFKENPFEKVICDKENNYILPSAMKDVVKKKAKELGFDFHFHMLRHTFSTTLFFSNVDIKTCQELMRHESVNTTMNSYTHCTEQAKKSEIDRVFSQNHGKIMENTLKAN